MREVGIRALGQNASAVVAATEAGKTVTITVCGKAVAQLTRLPVSPLERLLQSGLARAPKRDVNDLPPPAPGPKLSAELATMHDAERF